MKKRSLMILPLAAAFALSGCGGSDSSGSNDSAPADAAQAQSQPANEAPTLDGAQVKTVAESMVEGEEKAQVLDGDTIAANMPQAKKMIDEMKIEPAKCAEVIAEQSSWDVEGINMAVATVVDGTNAKSYSVASYEDDAKLEAARKGAESKDLNGCDSFTMEAQGQKLTASAEILDGTSDAELTVVTKTNVAMDGVDVPMNSISVQALDGRTAISASASGDVKDSQDLIDSLIKDVNKGLAEAKNVK